MKSKITKEKPSENAEVEISEVKIVNTFVLGENKKLIQIFPWILSAILLIICIVLIVQKPAPQSASDIEIAKVVSQVGKLIVLPTGELPTIATITDLKQLKGQAFFNNAKVGDKVLIYTKAQKAILYSPSENKVVEVAPLTNTASSTKK